MNHYTFSIENPHLHFIKINVKMLTNGKPTMLVRLPSWRPGRYEMADFAKNIKGFKVFDAKGNSLEFAKRKKDEWFIQTNDAQEIFIEYLYYANELNAGATILNESQFYVNPVNCCVYEANGEGLPCGVTLNIPESYKVASSMDEVDSNKFYLESVHELLDTPFICSDSLQHNSFTMDGIVFNIWFQGEVKPDWERLITDFEKYTRYQLDKMGGFPVDNYHYLIQIDTKKAYHGVEHQKSTVLYLGPSYDVFENLYTELLGVSSHELYHTWNVKAIRPADMFPYQYNAENYTDLGYVTEGVTTYMGDRILFESEVFSASQYHKELGSYLNRHFHNDGRSNYSVAESSFDTWLDGYVMGIPGRKTSIYTEGCLIAYICDMRIREATNGLKSLHDVMRRMYELTNQSLGYTEDIYKGLLEDVAQVSFTDVFEGLIHGTEEFKPYLDIALAYDGRSFSFEKSKITTNQYGIKGVASGSEYVIKQILDNSAAANCGFVTDDIIFGVNGISINNDLDKWLAYFDGKQINLHLNRDNQIKKVTLTAQNEVQFYNCVITEN